MALRNSRVRSQRPKPLLRAGGAVSDLSPQGGSVFSVPRLSLPSSARQVASDRLVAVDLSADDDLPVGLAPQGAGPVVTGPEARDDDSAPAEGSIERAAGAIPGKHPV